MLNSGSFSIDVQSGWETLGKYHRSHLLYCNPDLHEHSVILITRRIRKKLECYLRECVLLQREGPLHRLRCASQRNHKRSVSSSSHSCYTSFTPSQNIITQTHWWHSSDVKRVKTYWSGKSHQHVLVARPATAAELPPAARQLSPFFSFLFFFLLNLAHVVSPPPHVRW